MRLKRGLLLTFLLVIFCSISVFAANVYVKDEAGVLSSNTINTVNSNFQKLETNSGAQVRIAIVKTLGKTNVDDYAANIVKTGTTTDKYVIFVVATADHKTKMFVGKGLNSTITNNETNRIVHLPDVSFKKGDFNGGIQTVGKAIDQDITTKAIKTGNATVKTDGYSTSVVPKKHYGGTILLVLLIIISLAIIIWAVRKHLQKQAEKDVAKFAKEHGVEDSLPSSSTFKSSSLGSSNSSSNNTSRSNSTSTHSSASNSSSYTTSSSRTSYTPPVQSTSHTTIINNGNNNNGFIEGMLVNEMLHDHHEHHHHDYHDSYNDNSYNNNSYNNNSYDNNSSNDNVTSGDWESSSSSNWEIDTSSSSDWGSDSSSSWDSDSGSSWDSGSDSSGSDW